MTDPQSVVGDSSPTVLAVDDEPDLAELYRVYLDDTYDVRVATGGEEALSMMDDSVDVVLLDRRMPDMSGHEVLDMIREKGYDARIAMLTAVEPDVDIVDMPFDDYKTKPVTREDLVALVEVLLHRAAFDERSQRFFALASKRSTAPSGGVRRAEPAVLRISLEEGRARSLRNDWDGGVRGVDGPDAFGSFGGR